MNNLFENYFDIFIQNFPKITNKSNKFSKDSSNKLILFVFGSIFSHLFYHNI